MGLSLGAFGSGTLSLDGSTLSLAGPYLLGPALAGPS